MTPGAGVLSVVERGWFGARDCSLELSARGVPVLHAIKGRLTADELRLIEPRPLITIRAVPRPIFRAWLWLAIARLAARRRIRWCLVDHERTARELAPWLRLLGVRLIELRERADGYDLVAEGRLTSPDQVFGAK
jgi:hypothetical protein